MRIFLPLVALLALLPLVAPRDPAPLPAAVPGAFDALGQVVAVVPPIIGDDLRLSITPHPTDEIPPYAIWQPRRATVTWTNSSKRPLWFFGFGFGPTEPLYSVFARSSAAAPWRNCGPRGRCGNGIGEHAIAPGASYSFEIDVPRNTADEQVMVSVSYTRLPATASTYAPRYLAHSTPASLTP